MACISIAIDSGLPRPEILSGPFEEVGEIELSDSAEANPPLAA
jgi:hypothetical protein